MLVESCGANFRFIVMLFHLHFHLSIKMYIEGSYQSKKSDAFFPSAALERVTVVIKDPIVDTFGSCAFIHGFNPIL